MELALRYYQEHLASLLDKSQHLIKKNKAVSLGAAVVLTAFFYLRRSFTTPPRSLRHLPHPESLAYLKDVLTKVSYHTIAERHTMPAIARSKYGIISVCRSAGQCPTWSTYQTTDM